MNNMEKIIALLLIIVSYPVLLFFLPGITVAPVIIAMAGGEGLLYLFSFLLPILWIYFIIFYIRKKM